MLWIVYRTVYLDSCRVKFDVRLREGSFKRVLRLNDTAVVQGTSIPCLYEKDTVWYPFIMHCTAKVNAAAWQ